MRKHVLVLIGLAVVLLVMPIQQVQGQSPAENAEAEAEALVEPQTKIRPEVDPFDIPSYSNGDLKLFGESFVHIVDEQDTLHDIARHYDLGFVELRAANPGIDAWAPPPGSEIFIPAQRLIPRAPQDGIIINLAEMRLYYFPTAQSEPVITHPLGIGREGLETPLGRTSVVRKAAGPSWHPTPRMRKENPDLPWRVPPGASNPLGSHALYLGWEAFLIHGTNKPWGMGRRVSSGCIRMYPEDISNFYSRIPVGTKVTAVEQPVKAAVIDNQLYLEVNPTGQDVYDIELTGLFDMDEDAEIPEDLEILLQQTINDMDIDIEWQAVLDVWQEKRGYPIVVGRQAAVGLAEEQSSHAAKPLYMRNKRFNR